MIQTTLYRELAGCPLNNETEIISYINFNRVNLTERWNQKFDRKLLKQNNVNFAEATIICKMNFLSAG